MTSFYTSASVVSGITGKTSRYPWSTVAIEIDFLIVFKDTLLTILRGSLSTVEEVCQLKIVLLISMI